MPVATFRIPPVPEDCPLPLDEIAYHWADGNARKETVYRTNMIRAWWRGELPGPEKPDRLEVLRFLYGHPGPDIAFTIPGSERSPDITGTDDGSVVVDLRLCVPIPNVDAKSWTSVDCAPAFAVVAEKWTEGLSDPPFFGLLTMKIARFDFMNWVAQEGFRWPSFWSGKPPKRAQTPERVAKAFVSSFVEGAGGHVPPLTGPHGLVEAAKRRKLTTSRATLGKLLGDEIQARGLAKHGRGRHSNKSPTGK